MFFCSSSTGCTAVGEDEAQLQVHFIVQGFETKKDSGAIFLGRNDLLLIRLEKFSI